MTKLVLRFIAYGVIVIPLFLLVGLEGYYRILLPKQLPAVSAEPIPTQVRDALWLGCGAKRKHDLHPLFPFIISLFFPQNRPDELLLSRIARIHIGRLQQEGKLPHEKNLKFQLREAAVSTWISRHWTADQAVDTYGSLVWMGSGHRGLQAAARNLFEEKLDNLSHSQVVLLMAMMRSPRSYDPACHPEQALNARNHFLQKMKEAALLDDEELERAISMPLGVSSACEQSK
ncbi:putative Multimodular transpeptidase-transglycosylase [Syntrophobacter sp. SbD1]|nr:putative Multimodular transpeptidase-transglycosylase [Syntrophobacter sp. SbD1]